MSHNKIIVATQLPDSSSNINIDLENINNIRGIAGNEKLLKYIGGQWRTSFLSSMFRSNGYAAGWSTVTRNNSSNSYTSTGSLDSYRTWTTVNWGSSPSPKFNSGNVDLNRTTHGGVQPTAQRWSRVELSANGRYLLFATTRAYMGSSSSFVKWQWKDINTDENLSPVSIQYGSDKTKGKLSFIVGYAVVTSGSKTCDIRCIETNGSNDDRSVINADIFGAFQLS